MMLQVACPDLAQPLRDAYHLFEKMVHDEGVAWGRPETPPGASRPDPKRYFDFDGRTAGVPAPLLHLRGILLRTVDQCASVLEQTLRIPLDAPLSSMVDQDEGPVLRLTWYPESYVEEINQSHCDIDLFTILPAATRPGLEWRRGSDWSTVQIDANEVVVMPGEILQELGAAEAVTHRVVSTGEDRISCSLFVNAKPSLLIRENVLAGDLMGERLRAVQRLGNNNA
jgi:hypothetical protein|tara:strand:+ start:9382 stop:10059 length:678 start_codon:yes stop_codon:yes gene_type:complete